MTRDMCLFVIQNQMYSPCHWLSTIFLLYLFSCGSAVEWGEVNWLFYVIINVSQSYMWRHKCAGGLNLVYWCLTSHTTIFLSYKWRHRCAGRLTKKLYLRSGSQRHRHFAGFFNVPVLHRHGTTLFIRGFRHTAPFSRLLRHAGGTEDVFST